MLKFNRLTTSIIGVALLAASPVSAIPSPELIIGSVSSLGQVMAVVFALLSGGLATIGAKLGMKPRTNGQSNAHVGKAAVIFGSIALALLAVNFWQYNQKQQTLQSRLEATLVRPAQFAGTKIQDESLKETSFDAQKISDLAISTTDANALLQGMQSDSNVMFVDIRETAERKMGSLKNSSHVRFPDIQQSLEQYEGKQVVLFCQNGNRSSETCAELRAKGIDCRFIAGGIEKWIVEGLPFSNSKVRSLSDLRAIPEYKNKSKLLDTATFTGLRDSGDLQIIDTRYPGDFATGYLPGAINIPLRALPTNALQAKIDALENKPTIVACYDRRSCFMGQVLGWELANKGIEFLGRYTTPWEFFIPPKPKPHIQKWQAAQSITWWQKSVSLLAQTLTDVASYSNIILAIFGLSMISRLLVLPIAIKSERDQIISNANSDELKQIKQKLKNDPIRRARAIKGFYAQNGLTPMRNMSALLFLPITMLGLSAVEEASKTIMFSFLWVSELGAQDPYFILPTIFALLAGVYLHFAVAKTATHRLIVWLLAVPLMFGLVFQLSTAGNIYLSFSLLLLLVQRAYVVGALQEIVIKAQNFYRNFLIKNRFNGIIPLKDTHALVNAGNKALRLSAMRKAGFSVPDGVVIPTPLIERMKTMGAGEKSQIVNQVWSMVGQQPSAVRSSAAAEDGADKSFAGIFESILDVSDAGMADAIEQVASSFESVHSGHYDAQLSNAHQGNILIQRMVEARYSGVLFTQSPQAPGQMLIELAEGTADDLVSGRVTPLMVQFGRYSRQQLDDAVSPIDLQPLLEMGQQIEELFGSPQDIEWAYGPNGFEIVQSRDITTLMVGSTSEIQRRAQWENIFSRAINTDPDTVILEQDEMSEVLPRPTPLSFSIMTSIWRAGGSVDLAVRSLGLTSYQPEGQAGHLVRFFGKLYSDPKAKHEQALKMSGLSMKRLTKEVGQISGEFENSFLPKLDDDVNLYTAIDFEALPRKLLIQEISRISQTFVNETYLFAEKVNILAGFTLTEALNYCADNNLDGATILRGHLPHSPANLMSKHSNKTQKERMQYLIAEMGHRSVFDYELADRRYSETPDLLWEIANSHHEVGVGVVDGEVPKPISDALLLQDLKENAKHNALRLFAQLRRAVLALGIQSGLGASVFYLTLDELLALLEVGDAECASIAKYRHDQDVVLRKLAPKNTKITLQHGEVLSAPFAQVTNSQKGGISGMRVSGETAVMGRCYVVSDGDQETGAKLNGFKKGDILICQMVHPAWLPHVMDAGAVLSQIGGWLSHMAIVAREKDVLMFVGCEGLDGLEMGHYLNITEAGQISVIDGKSTVKLAASG